MELEITGLTVEAHVSYTVQVHRYEPARLEGGVKEEFKVVVPPATEHQMYGKLREIQRKLYNACWDQARAQMEKYLEEIYESEVEEEPVPESVA